LKATYGNSLRHGNEFTGLPEGTTIDILSLDNHVKDRYTALMLPTCISERTSITKFDDHLVSGATSWGANQRLPCSCGDWRSNEASGFIYAFFYAPEKRDYKTGAADELLLQICRWCHSRLIHQYSLKNLNYRS
jgi:hypothetical protein